MKKYKLKKDLPTVRAGAVFVRKTNETMQVDMLHRVDSEDVFLPPSIEVDDINNFDEWFEEVKEFEEWRPEDGEEYKALSDGRIYTYYVRSVEDRICNFHVTTGNCYPLDTPDEVIIKEQKLIPQAMHRLKMAAKKAWFDFNGSEGPDWSDIEQGKYYTYFNYSYMTRTYSVVEASLAQTLGCVYFPTKESCQAHIDNNPEDLKLLFGVE